MNLTEEQWDQQIVQDVEAGRLDHVIARAEDDIKAQIMTTEIEKLERLQTLKELYKAAIIAGQKNSSQFPKAWDAIWEAALLNGYLQETELEGQHQISNDRLVELLNKLNWVGLIEINEPPYEPLPVI